MSSKNGVVEASRAAGAVSEGLIPAPALPWIRVVMFGLGFAVYGMAAMGLYDLSKVFRPSPGPKVMHKPSSGG